MNTKSIRAIAAGTMTVAALFSGAGFAQADHDPGHSIEDTVDTGCDATISAGGLLGGVLEDIIDRGGLLNDTVDTVEDVGRDTCKTVDRNL
ncbi:hypothetical protein NDR87_33860 [Nocardia sp. CDC159]|uniref:Secreted protein n=1 Tax=Nocardia pulmonis TaxID=2951408 RepID=A0A9X2EHS9_9NOCA|nr:MULTISPECIES: hypothetical protein [Nocardia]MCM6778483.1 hypothetical protein [Nocardia pulmonis]MCM6791372.1 hypothetical protein [Nocardia sp. CDC159]